MVSLQISAVVGFKRMVYATRDGLVVFFVGVSLGGFVMGSGGEVLWTCCGMVVRWFVSGFVIIVVAESVGVLVWRGLTLRCKYGGSRRGAFV